MINKRFLRIQLKRLWIPILVIGVIVGASVGSGVGGHYLVPYWENNSDLWTTHSIAHNNAASLAVYYRTVLFGFLLAYSFIALIRLLLVEQERGYVVSWLITPMTRWTIFATKYLAMILGLLIIDVFALLLQLILYGILMADFNQYVGYIFLSHLSVLVGAFFLASLMWLVGSIFTRQWIPILIISVIITWCTVASILGLVGPFADKAWMKAMYNVSLFSLIHTPFERYQGTCRPDEQFGTILPIRAMDYAWQIPTMAILGTGCFIGSQFILRNKDYNV